MAFGIDAVAHKACLRNQLPTIGVLAHGLSHMYPGEHKKMAGDIIGAAGAMVTEYWSSEEPDKHLFPARNRIVAGMCDALVVIESGLKGGSMLTAELASGYNREIYAFPGRANDPQSEGCNHLIKINKAQLLSRPEELADHLGWKRQPAEKQGMQYMLPLSLNVQEKKVLEQFTSQHTMHIEQLNACCDMSMPALSAILLELEIQGFIRTLPGKLYKRI
jgi:DNA processing protein